MQDHDQAAMEMTEEAREKQERRASFASKLFMGEIDMALLHPFPKQSLVDKQIGDVYIAQLSDYLRKNLNPEEVEREREVPKEVVMGLAKMGAFALKISKEYGGLGFSQTNYNRIVQHVASFCGSTAVLLSAHQSIGVPQPLKLYGTKEQKRKYLPRFREGQISAFALTEPEVGSDPARMSSTAVLSADGTHYVLNGTKVWCTNGTIADVIIVMAKTKPKIVAGVEKTQISMFILEMQTPGVEVVHRCEFMGLGAIYNGVLKFTNVKIPAENLVGEEGRGLAMALATINVGRLTLPSACVGGAKQCLKMVRRWGGERVQWGQPVGLHEFGREKISFIAATTFAMEAVAALTSRWQDLGGVDIRMEAAMAKLFCTEALWQIGDAALQLLGGRGYEKASSLIKRGEEGYPVERMVRDCRVNRILEGSTEIMKLFLAREALDPHLKRLGDLIKGKLSRWSMVKQGMGLFFSYSGWYLKQLFQQLTATSPLAIKELNTHLRFAQKSSHQLARLLFYYMAKYQKKLEKRQLILGRLMEIGTELFTLIATCSYVLSLPDEERKSALDLANYFCKISRRRIVSSFAALKDNDDRATSELAKKIIEKEAVWLEEGVIDL